MNEMNRVHSEGRYVLYDLSGQNLNRSDNAKRAYQKMQEEVEEIELM
jgi:hypothetical protein